MPNINDYSPRGGRQVKEDGTVTNLADKLDAIHKAMVTDKNLAVSTAASVKQNTLVSTSTTIAAGQTLTLDATPFLKGCLNVSVYLVDFNQTYDITLKSRPLAGMVYVSDTLATGQTATATAGTRRYMLTLQGPLTDFDIKIDIKNTSASDGVLKGLYVLGR
jgi:hypothetical protein